MEIQNIYKILELEPVKVYTQQELQTAFKKACLKRHPDKGGSTEQFRELRQAFQLAKEQLTNNEEWLTRFYPKVNITFALEEILSGKKVCKTARQTLIRTCQGCMYRPTIHLYGPSRYPCPTCQDTRRESYQPVVEFCTNRFRPEERVYVVNELGQSQQYRAEVDVLIPDAHLDKEGNLVIDKPIKIPLKHFLTDNTTHLIHPNSLPPFLSEIWLPTGDLADYNDQIALKIKRCGFPKFWKDNRGVGVIDVPSEECTDLILSEVKVELPTRKQFQGEYWEDGGSD